MFNTYIKDSFRAIDNFLKEGIVKQAPNQREMNVKEYYNLRSSFSEKYSGKLFLVFSAHEEIGFESIANYDELNMALSIFELIDLRFLTWEEQNPNTLIFHVNPQNPKE